MSVDILDTLHRTKIKRANVFVFVFFLEKVVWYGQGHITIEIENDFAKESIECFRGIVHTYGYCAAGWKNAYNGQM